MRTSQPKPAATGKQARRAAGDSARWPERGSRASKPARTSIRARARRLASPKPPPSRVANAATLRSPPPSRSGASSPERSASQRSRAPGGAARSAADRAWPFPRRGSRKTIAPAASAASAVPSREPSSATITSASGNVRRRVATVFQMTCSSSRAGTRIVSGSSTGRLLGQRCDGRQARLPCPRAEVAAQRRVGKQGDECELSELQVDVIDSGEARGVKCLERGAVVLRALHTDHRNTYVREACVKTLEEDGGRTGLRLRRADDHDPVSGSLRRPDRLLDDLTPKCVPQRSVLPRDELLPQRLTEVLELLRTGVVREERLLPEQLLERARIDRDLDRRESQCGAGVRIGQRLRDLRASIVARGADEDHGDPLPLQSIR